MSLFESWVNIEKGETSYGEGEKEVEGEGGGKEEVGREKEERGREYITSLNSPNL